MPNPNDNQIAVITAIAPTGAWQMTMAKQFFAMHLSLGVFNPPAPTTYPEKDLLPWTWTWAADSLVAIGSRPNASGGFDYDTFLVQLFDDPKYLATPHFKTGKLDHVQQSWIKVSADASWNPANDPSSTMGTAESASLPEQLIYLSTFPGDLPQKLKLLSYFRLRADANGFGKNGKLKLEEITSFVVAPKIINLKLTPDDKFPFNDLTTGTENWKLGWTYKDDTGAVANRAAFVKPLSIKREAGKPLNFCDDGQSPPLTMDFARLWFFKPEAMHPWTNKLDHQALEIFHVFDRFSDAASLDGSYQLDFETQISWGADQIPHRGTHLPQGPLPGVDKWLALEVPTATLQDRRGSGISFTAHKGRVIWGPLEIKRPTETVATLIKESLPLGARQIVDRNWNAQAWGELVKTPALPIGMVHESKPDESSGSMIHRHAFNSNDEVFNFKAGEKLLLHVFLDSRNPPDEIMLEFADPWWEQLQLKALAFNAQWEAPSPEANPSDPKNSTDVLVNRLIALLGVENPAMEKVVRGKLLSLRKALTDKGTARPLWLKLLALTCDTEEQPGAIFEKVRDQRELLDLMLFAQWSPLFIKRADSDLMGFFVQELGDKWDAIIRTDDKKSLLALFTSEGRRQQHTMATELLGNFGPAEFANEANAAQRLAAELNKLFQLVQNNNLPALDTKDFSAEALWKDYVAKYGAAVERIFTDRDEQNRRALTKPGGLSIKIDDLANDEDTKPVDDDDVWRKLSGVGLMIREKQKPWHVVSAANVRVKGETDNLFEEPAVALVPLRLPYRNGVRHPVLTYEQRSLIAPSPLGDAVSAPGGFALNDDNKNPSIANANNSPYEYSTVIKNGGPDFTGLRLQRLTFGQEYELAAFMMDTSGGLPNEMAQIVDGEAIPWIFDHSKWVAGQSITDPGNNYQSIQKYVREVPVGQTRVRLELANGTFNYPEIPPRVFPLAKEIEKDNSADPTNNQQAGELPGLPLLLVHRQLSSAKATLRLRLPAVELELLERWPGIATGAGFKDLLTAYHERLLKLAPQDVQAEVNYDTSLDDPAVSQLLVLLEKFDFEDGGKWKPVTWEVITPPFKVEPKEIDKYQKQSIISVAIKENATNYSLVRDGEKLELLTPDNTAAVARVSIYALVPRTIADGLFARDFLKTEDEAEELNKLSERFKPFTAANICLKPYRLLVERPSTVMPSAFQLWQSISVSRTSLDTVAIDLKLDQVSGDPKPVRERFRNIVSVDLLKQPWRWQGRKIDNDKDWLKGKSINDADRELLKWEAGAFAQMDDLFDTLSIPRPFHLYDAGTENPPPFYTDSFDKDLRAYYVRYAARAHSRYEGLLASARSLVTSKQSTEDGVLSGIGWKRAFVPYRGPKPPKPVIKAVVPLTQSASDDAQVNTPAPLLIVLDETMFGFCGITEFVECEIERVSMPDSDDTKKELKHLFQVGHDPIIFGKETPAGTPADYAGILTAERVTLRCDDAVGYTFDTDARQPLFSTSSLVVHSPPIPEPKSGLRSWDFARLRFRRMNRVAAPPTIPEAYDETEWTKPLWVQFLPPSSFNIWPAGADARKYFATANKVTIALPPRSANNHGLGPSLDGERFVYRVLVTKVISDFQGNPEHEQIIALNPPLLAASISTDQRNLTFTIPQGLDAAARYRLLEIQRRPNAAIDDVNFWVKLLEATDPKDADYRITRISPFFGVNPG